MEGNIFLLHFPVDLRQIVEGITHVDHARHHNAVFFFHLLRQLIIGHGRLLEIVLILYGFIVANQQRQQFFLQIADIGLLGQFLDDKIAILKVLITLAIQKHTHILIEIVVNIHDRHFFFQIVTDTPYLTQ